MSAFVIDTETMNRVVRTICAKGRYSQVIDRFFNIDTSAKDAATEIGRRLFTLNIEAVTQRYPDCENDPSNLPGTDDCASYPTSYKVKLSNTPPSRKELIAGYKAIRCLIYQCSEGDVTKTAQYIELEAAAGEIAGEIVTNLPEYETAPWG